MEGDVCTSYYIVLYVPCTYFNGLSCSTEHLVIEFDTYTLLTAYVYLYYQVITYVTGTYIPYTPYVHHTLLYYALIVRITYNTRIK